MEQESGSPSVRVILHAGLSTEASEAIGAGLEANRARLRQAGISVVTSIEVADALSIADPAKMAARFNRVLTERFDGSLGETLVVSSPSILGAERMAAAEVGGMRPLLETRLAALVEALPADQVDVAVHVLRQDSLIAKLHEADIEEGGSARVAKVALADDDLPLSYASLVERLSRLPGVSKVIVRPEEILGAGPNVFFGDFIDAVGLDDLELEEFHFQVPETTWSNRALRIASEINSEMRSPQERSRLHQFLKELIPRPAGEAPRVGSRSAMVALLEKYAMDNQRLFIEKMPDLPPDTYATVAATEELVASMGPGQLTVSEIAPVQPGVYAAPRNQMDITDLTLHVGLQKTGTTSIQKALTKLRRELHGCGVAYVDRRDMMGLPNRRAWAAYNRSGKAKYKAFTKELRAAVARRYHAVQERNGEAPRTVLISNESLVGVHARIPDFERPLRPRAQRAISQVIEILEPAHVRLLLYVRRQDTLIESQYMHAIHGGAAFDFEDYVRNVTASPVLKFSNLAHRLSRIDGVGEIRVRPFELIRSGWVPFLEDFLSPLKLGAIDLQPVESIRANPSYSGRALSIAIAVNPLLERKAEAARMRKFLEELIPASKNPAPVLMSHARREQIIETYRSDNERLFAEFMPDLPIDIYSTLEGTSRLKWWFGEGGVTSRNEI